jgi:hypothetical protein
MDEPNELDVAIETDSARRLFGRRYLSGEVLAVVKGTGGDKLRLEVAVGIVSWGFPFTARAMVESSFEPAFCPRAERSDEDEEDVVEIEEVAGYRDRFAVAPES